MYPQKVHKKCNKLMNAYVPASKPSAGEWHCPYCNESERMTDPAEYNTWNAQLNQHAR